MWQPRGRCSDFFLSDKLKLFVWKLLHEQSARNNFLKETLLPSTTIFFGLSAHTKRSATHDCLLLLVFTRYWGLTLNYYMILTHDVAYKHSMKLVLSTQSNILIEKFKFQNCNQDFNVHFILQLHSSMTWLQNLIAKFK